MTFDQRFNKVTKLITALRQRRDKMMTRAALDLQFAVKDTAHELDLTLERLGTFTEVRESLAHRRPLGGSGSWVAVMLSYNGSAWLNLVITAAYMAGNRVMVKFSSKGPSLMGLMEEIYRPIFGGDIKFYRASGKTFMEEAIKNPNVSAVVFFGSDEHVLPYQEAFRKSGKKLIFEGPGVDPFIVFPDAPMELAMADLMSAKFAYSGQTCTAPKRIFIHESVYDQFLEMMTDKVKSLMVGDPEDRNVDVTPLASDLAVDRIKAALNEAVKKGAKILAGGRVERNLVYPTVVKDATDDMLGMREEVFGPVLFTTSFSDREEVMSAGQKPQVRPPSVGIWGRRGRPDGRGFER